MRALLLVFSLSLAATPALTAESVTVPQLQQKLAAASPQTDAELASAIGQMQLTQRLSPPIFQSLSAQLPGDQSRQALLAVADESQFLAPPPSQALPMLRPTPAVQAHILSLARHYVAGTLPMLPDFIATRQILRFQSNFLISAFNSDDPRPHSPFQAIQRSVDEVRYRDGQEATTDDIDQGGAATPKTGTLNTSGTFGAILGTVFGDSAHARLRWLRWEQGPLGPLAVFRFQMPQKLSHYQINYCCLRPSTAFTHVDKKTGRFHNFAGYRAELAIDPDTGAIFRLVIESELPPWLPLRRASVVVEYGQVAIAGKTYICPIRSISISSAPIFVKVEVLESSRPNWLVLTTMLTDTQFQGYRRFRGDMRILTGVVPADPSATPQPPQ